ncbi:MAG TPA: hypothetical protein VEV83_21790 [Parafilimonas sp.]|nr:hypothetical protein [Parafilimonas sp.]
MKKFITVSMIAFVLLCSINGHTQRTPEDLAIITFYCFQEHNLDSFYRLIPTVNEIRDAGATAGVDTNSASFKEFVTQYPSFVDQFKQQCAAIENDSTRLHFSWTNSNLDSIEISERNIPLDNKDPNSKTVVVTVLDIYFRSNSHLLRLTLGDANKYNGLWKPGNRIALSKL